MSRQWRAFVGDEPHRTRAKAFFPEWEDARTALRSQAHDQAEEMAGPDGCQHCYAAALEAVEGIDAAEPGRPFRTHIGRDELTISREWA